VTPTPISAQSQPEDHVVPSSSTTTPDLGAMNHAMRNSQRLQTLLQPAYPQVKGVPPVGVEPTLGGF
jgi:hypothetical protein